MPLSALAVGCFCLSDIIKHIFTLIVLFRISMKMIMLVSDLISTDWLGFVLAFSGLLIIFLDLNIE